MQTTKDWMMELVRKHENSKKLYSIAKESRKYMRELDIDKQEELNHDLVQTKATKEMRQKEICSPFLNKHALKRTELIPYYVEFAGGNLRHIYFVNYKTFILL